MLIRLLISLRIALLHTFGFPSLWLRWPQAVWRGMAAAASPASCLSSFEYWTRHYYEHIARNFTSAGRLGYVWNEALGTPFGPRIYNNTMTYRLFGAFSPRAFRLLTLAAYLGTIIGLGLATGHGALGLALGLLLLGSPAGLHALVGYMIKPEVPWWALALVAVTAALGGDWVPALAAAGILLMANASVAAITALFIGPLWIYAAWTGATLPGGWALALLAPGALKTLLRILQARAEGMGQEVAAEQKKAAQRKPVSLRELAGFILWFGVPLALASATTGAQSGSVALMFGIALLFWLANGHLVKVADTVTVLLTLLTVLVALTLYSGAWLGLAGIAWFAWYKPFAAYPAMAGQAAGEAHRQALIGNDRLQALSAAARDFPWFSLKGLPDEDKVLRLLATIPDRARVLLESDGDGRWDGSHLHFRNWADARVAARQVELVNQFFLVNLMEPALADRYLDRFNAKALDSATMLEICRSLGVSRVIAFTAETVAAMENAGFRAVASLPTAEMTGLADMLHMPATGIVLLATPGDPAVLEPAADWSRKGNTLRWMAQAGEEYLVRYRYHRHFRARQGETPIEVSPAGVIDGLPLRFMRVKAVTDGPIQLRFMPGWLG